MIQYYFVTPIGMLKRVDPQKHMEMFDLISASAAAGIDRDRVKVLLHGGEHFEVPKWGRFYADLHTVPKQ